MPPEVRIAELEQELAARNFELDLMCEVSSRIDGTLSYGDLFRLLLVETRRAVPYDVAAGLLLSGTADGGGANIELYLSEVRPLIPAARDEVEARLRKGTAALLDQPLPDAPLPVTQVPPLAKQDESPGDGLPVNSLGTFFQVPIVGLEGNQGLLLFGAATADAFNERHVRLLYAMSRQAAGVVDRLRDVVRRERQRFRVLVENLPHGVALLGPGSKLEILNPAGQELFPKVCNPELGTPLEEIGRTRVEDLGFYSPVDLPFSVDEEDGVLRVEVVPLDEHGGDGRVVTARDVTELMRARAVLLQSNEEMERQVAERTAELSVRAEQLSRLASELTLAEQRERRRLAEVLHDHLQQLIVGAKYGIRALPDSVGEERLEATDGVLNMLDEAIDVSRSLSIELCPPVLHDAGLPAALRWLGPRFETRHGLTVKVDVEEAADPGREDLRALLFQSVRELLFNVVKHAGVSEASVVLKQAGLDSVRLVVADEGGGFDADAFLRQPNSGGGFGLFSVRERLSLLGGSLHVESSADTGTVFTLTAKRGGVGSTGLLGPAPTTRVLLVDDHNVVRNSLRLLVEDEADLEVVGEAADGREAVKKALALEPDVVLMDITMPEMDGVEATRRIAAVLPEARIVGLSGFGEGEREHEILEAGAKTYVSKKGDPDVLLQAIRGLES
ncbi:response regulator [Alienimonas chondri]|uniref:histidine kinase n=1 Tax=Alienimonas chondri TaxID=2681879 RepID=A0ABX1V828_9PLAN|nr:response regulator [Alienimonas chondri]NNJ24343.1 Chemotaxis response regulator protein-glutamate methylesterase [Alienimonas chondri]